jgi:hypothetical protein
MDLVELPGHSRQPWISRGRTLTEGYAHPTVGVSRMWTAAQRLPPLSVVGQSNPRDRATSCMFEDPQSGEWSRETWEPASTSYDVTPEQTQGRVYPGAGRGAGRPMGA